MKVVGGVAYVTADEMRKIDAAAVEDYAIDVLQLMENAGLTTASLAKRMLGGDAGGGRVACLAGKGNNGGDGLVAARHLYNWGADVQVILANRPENLEGTAARQLSTTQRMGLKASNNGSSLGSFDLLIDSLLGYNSIGNPREPIAGRIRSANASGVPILAVDLPSGLDPTTGEPNDPCIIAAATITFALPKTGFLNPKAKRFVGQLYLADISVPRAVYKRHRVPNPFGKETIVRLS
jgi:NAD(P)H-hydrate epimerase